MTTRSVDTRSMKARSVHSRGMNARGLGPGGSKPLRRHRKGAGALVAVLLLAALAGTGLAVHYAAQHAARQVASSFEAGQVFGEWVLAAHRASQEHGFALRLETEPAFVLTPAALRALGAVPPGLPSLARRYAAFTVGIMDDGRGAPGNPPVAMAFGVLEPARPEAAPALRSGAIAAGLAALAEAGSAETAMAAYVPAIEAALGRPLAADGLYVTADAGLRYDDRTLYRRAQPGRPGLNRMETALDAGGHDVTGIADAEGFTASVSRDAEVGGSGSVTGDADAGGVTAGIARGGRPGGGLAHRLGRAPGGAGCGGAGVGRDSGGQRPSRSGFPCRPPAISPQRPWRWPAGPPSPALHRRRRLRGRC